MPWWPELNEGRRKEGVSFSWVHLPSRNTCTHTIHTCMHVMVQKQQEGGGEERHTLTRVWERSTAAEMAGGGRNPRRGKKKTEEGVRGGNEFHVGSPSHKQSTHTCTYVRERREREEEKERGEKERSEERRVGKECCRSGCGGGGR